MLSTRTDSNNVSECQGWEQDEDGTWGALTLTRSKNGFKTERGAKNWFVKRTADATLRRMGII